jgi:hypothetical protein
MVEVAWHQLELQRQWDWAEPLPGYSSSFLSLLQEFISFSPTQTLVMVIGPTAFLPSSLHLLLLFTPFIYFLP